MTPKEFFDKVVEMRRCQKEYLKNKRQIDLRISKQIEREVDEEIDRLQPDYSIYNIDSNLSYGFLTRGCPNRCKWCVVPKKEGKISPYMDIEEITAGRKKAILMDNNILASNYGLQQIEKIINWVSKWILIKDWMLV